MENELKLNDEINENTFTKKKRKMSKTKKIVIVVSLVVVIFVGAIASISTIEINQLREMKSLSQKIDSEQTKIKEAKKYINNIDASLSKLHSQAALWQAGIEDTSSFINRFSANLYSPYASLRSIASNAIAEQNEYLREFKDKLSVTNAAIAVGESNKEKKNKTIEESREKVSKYEKSLNKLKESPLRFLDDVYNVFLDKGNKK